MKHTDIIQTLSIMIFISFLALLGAIELAGPDPAETVTVTITDPTYTAEPGAIALSEGFNGNFGTVMDNINNINAVITQIPDYWNPTPTQTGEAYFWDNVYFQQDASHGILLGKGSNDSNGFKITTYKARSSFSDTTPTPISDFDYLFEWTLQGQTSSGKKDLATISIRCPDESDATSTIYLRTRGSGESSPDNGLTIESDGKIKCVGGGGLQVMSGPIDFLYGNDFVVPHSTPSAPTNGSMAYDINIKQFIYYAGGVSKWLPLNFITLQYSRNSSGNGQYMYYSYLYSTYNIAWKHAIVFGLDVSAYAAPGSGNCYTITVMKNGSSTSLSASISDTDKYGRTIEDIRTGNFVDFSAGDELRLVIGLTGSPSTSNRIAANVYVVPIFD